MIDTIIFDLDGTLLNTLDDLYLSTNYTLEQFSYPLRTKDEIRNFVGNGVAKLIERAIPDGLHNPDYEQCLNLFKDYYAQTMENNTAPYDGILELLETLQDNGIKVGVVSNKFDIAVKDLCKKYFGNLVSVAIGESATTRKKPNPDGVLRAIKELNSTKETTIYVGDSDVDILTAHNTGLKCIGVTWGYRNEELLKKTGADYVIHNPSEILKIFKNIIH